MAKTTAPLFGFGASGSLAKSIVFARWRGVGYARRHVIPANPKTTGQVLTRDIFSNLETRWKQGGPLVRAPWDRFATGQKFVGRNSYIGKNIAILRGDADMVQYIGSPGAKGGLPPTSMNVVAGSTQLTVDVTEPALPTGWTIQAAVVTALIDQTPEATVADIIEEGEDLTTTYQVVLTGLSVVLYQVQAWLRWVKPDGSIAYGPSIAAPGTPTA